MKLSDYVLDFLSKKNIETMFFVPGGGCMHLLDSLAKSESIEGISLLHEQSAAIAAESYAFTSSRPGAVLVTTGPGGTNAVTGVLSAWLDSIPCIFLSGQVKTPDLKSRFGVRSNGSQEAGIVDIVKSITKFAAMVTDKNAIRHVLEQAWHEATHGRKGPVWVDIPLDIQGSGIDPERLIGFNAPVVGRVDCSEPAFSIVRMIQKAKRPLIIAGNGLRESEGSFRRLAGKLGIPVIPTWKAADIITDSHPLYAGRCGTFGERAANFALQTCDLLISLGSRLDYSITGFDRSQWAPSAKKIVIDLDEREIHKLQVPVDLPLVLDVRDIVDALNGMDLTLPDFSAWMGRIRHWREKYPVMDSVPDSGGLPTIYRLAREICAQLGPEDVLVPASSGTVAEITYQALDIRNGFRVRSNHGLGSMGYELPSAIGAQIATGAQVVTIAGDGGVQLNIQELAVIAGRRLPIKIFVADNGGYASIRNMQRSHFQGRYLGSGRESGLFLPDMHDIARAYGIESCCIHHADELQAGVRRALESDGPFLCNVKIHEGCIASPRSSTIVREDGSLASTPLENLAPFLDPEELEREMAFE